MPFLEDRIEGRFVYHSHILEHEDGGMMANINVQPRSPSARRSRFRLLNLAVIGEGPAEAGHHVPLLRAAYAAVVHTGHPFCPHRTETLRKYCAFSVESVRTQRVCT